MPHRALNPVRLPLILPVLLVLAFCTPAAWGQDQADGDSGGAEGADSVQVQEERIRQLVDTLEDEQKREELVAQLRLLLEAQDQAAPPDERATIGDQMLGQLSQQLGSLAEAGQAVLDTPDHMLDMWNWLEADVESASGRSRWQDILRTIGMSIGAGLLAFFVAGIPVRRLGRRIALFSATPLRKLLAGVAGFVLDALPVVAFALAGTVALAAVDAGFVAGAMTANLLTVLTVAFATCALVRVVTRPRRPSMRLLPVSDGVARDLNRRFYWIIGVMTVAYALTETLPRIGMPRTASAAFLTLASLIAAAMLIGVIIKHRRPVRHGIERSARQGTIAGDIVRWLAQRWHVLAVLLVIVLLVTYIVGGDGLFIGAVGRIGLSLLTLAVGFAVWRLVVLASERRARRLEAQAPEAEVVRQSSTLLLTMFARLALFVGVTGFLAHVWLFDVFEWLGADAGRGLLEAIVTIAIIVTLAYAANRAISAVIDRIQNARRAESAEQRRRRVETLLPLLRNAAAVIIVAVTALIVLSEVGLDITPLLASAGVIGLAIGFGAQSLVKDVITGLFFLVEDAFGIGDIITVAGYSGVVEEMTIRSIKLRDLSGTVHVIPFGVVDAASNMTRDYSFSVFEVGVSYSSDVDEVIQCMRDVDEDLRRDPEMAANLVEPMEILGLDKFDDSAIVIKARIKTRPASQWGVMRAYNRLLKIRFDERGIEIPFPQRTLHMAPAAQRTAEQPVVEVDASDPQATSTTPDPDSEH